MKSIVHLINHRYLLILLLLLIVNFTTVSLVEANEKTLTAITKNEMESLIKQISSIALQAKPTSALLKQTSLFKDGVMIWSMPGAAYWPKYYFSHKNIKSKLSVVMPYFSAIQNGPLHFVEPSLFWKHTCNGDENNPYQGHWNLIEGDAIRAFAQKLNDQEALSYCKKQTNNNLACSQANLYQTQFTLIFQGNGSTVSFGLVRLKDKWVISDMAMSDQCDL